MNAADRASAERGTARAAVEIAWAEPAKAIDLAQVSRAAAGGDIETDSLTEQAIGIARMAQGDLLAAEQHLRAAIGLAEPGPLAAEARGALALLLALTGRAEEALDAACRPAPGLTGRPAATLAMRQALVLLVLGRDHETEEAHRRALHMLDAAGGDVLLEADIRNNFGMSYIQRRQWPAAATELDRAEKLYLAAGQRGNAAVVHHNRGLAAALRGDLPAALTAFDEAAERYTDAGIDPALLPVERAEALLSVLLVPDARRAAEEAVRTFARQRHAAHLVNARVVLARAALLDEDLAVATSEAERARRAAARQGRPAWAALAAYVGLRARFAGGERTPALLQACRRVATALEPAGWAIEALDARLLRARTALDLGRPKLARAELTEVTRGQADGPAELRARIWHAHALLRLAEGDPAGAEAALDAGLSVLEDFRASLGATELRVHASGHSGELALLGLRLALAEDRAPAALLWAERFRAGALLPRPAVPAADPELAADLAELRQVVAGITDAATKGGDTAGLRERQVELEQAVRHRSHRAGPRHLGGTPVLRSVGDLGLPADGPALVEYMTVDGELHAVVVRGRRAVLHRLGPVAAAEPELEALRYGLRRLAYGIGLPATLAAAAGLAELRAQRLDAIVLAPLRADLGDGPLVIVPTGSLHTIPWAALPSCAGRPVSVTPSAALWRRASAAPPAAAYGPPVFAAGPNLRHAAPEVATLARAYPGSRRFTGRNATVEAVTRALAGAWLAHIAAHGSFRRDNPLFSSLLLADGPLTVYDLERLERPPRHVVLSACESGLPAVHPGDELLGLAAALLGMGAVSLVATVVPVPDEASRPLMLRFHRHLRAGCGPAAALAQAQRPRPGQTWAERAAAAGFLCFGAG